MQQDACTKDVFRELDGFLVLMSILATIQAMGEGSPVVEPKEQVVANSLEATRLVLVILSDAIDDHPENAEFFGVRCFRYSMYNVCLLLFRLG